MLDQLTAEQVKVRASGTSTSQTAEATNSIEKSFSHGIRGAPKEKWSFLYDTNGMWYGIQTTNHAECFNMVMCFCRAFPLVGIVEFVIVLDSFLPKHAASLCLFCFFFKFT